MNLGLFITFSHLVTFLNSLLGFQFTVRPMDRTGNVADKRNLVSASKDNDKRNALSKRMTEKQRPTNKQGQRSANISIEGRAVK